MAQYSTSTKILGAVVFSMARVLYHPKVYSENGTKISDKSSLSEPTLLVCNHINHIDGTILSYVYRDYVIRNLAAKDRFEQGGFFKWYLEHSGCIPIDRIGVSTDWIHSSVKVLRQDKQNIAIYPEGRHGKNGEILPFHGGAAMIAAFSSAPVVVAYIEGPYKLFRRSRIIVSDPFRLDAPTEGMTADYIASQTDKMRNKMIELQSKLRSF